MIFKVYYQEQKDQVPVREKTKTLYIEAQSEREVREKLADTPYNIEYIHPLDGAHLEYEKNQENFNVMG